MPSPLEVAGMLLLMLCAVVAAMLLLIVLAAILQVAWNWARWGNPYGKTGKPPAKPKAPGSSPTVIIVPPEKGPQK